jgi:hypothetical protein
MVDNVACVSATSWRYGWYELQLVDLLTHLHLELGSVYDADLYI